METGKLTGRVPMVKIDGAKVRHLREKKGLTQLFLATAVEVTTDTISRWENKRYPTIKRENALKLAEVLEVDLEEILESEQKETEPDTIEQDSGADEAASPPVKKKGGRAVFMISVGVVLLIAFLGWLFFPAPQQKTLSAERLLPDHAVPGQPFPVVISVVNKEAEALSMILKETLPKGVTLLSVVPPYSAFDEKSREVKWLRKIDEEQIFSYMLRVDDSEETVEFNGTVASRQRRGRQIVVSGDPTVQMSTFHWADADADGRISDEEILVVYDVFSEIKGLEIDIDLVEEIWLGSGYVWSSDEKKFEVLP